MHAAKHAAWSVPPYMQYCVSEPVCKNSPAAHAARMLLNQFPVGGQCRSGLRSHEVQGRAQVARVPQLSVCLFFASRQTLLSSAKRVHANANNSSRQQHNVRPNNWILAMDASQPRYACACRLDTR